jgi:RNA polymerase sigma-70 factor, ECF subfamily
METPADLAAFIAAEHPRLVHAASVLLDDHAVAEEIAQEALLRAASRWEHVRELEAPGGWVHRVAVNLATSQLRRRAVERRARGKLARGEHELPPDSDTAVMVREALRALPVAQRRVLVLRHVLGWSAPDIAALDGGTPEAVRRQLHRARAALREQLPLDIEETTDAR